MIPEQPQNQIAPPNAPETFEQRADRLLNAEDRLALKTYIERNGIKLAASTSLAFFQLYLNGSGPREIHSLNKGFPYESILYEMIGSDWEKKKTEYLFEMEVSIKDKLVKANLETVGLLTDMLAVANKQHGDKFKKYLQTGNEADLTGAIKVESITTLLRVLEGLQKAVGLDKNKKDVSTITNIQVNAETFNHVATSPAEAAKGLAALAAAKRKGGNK